jgi:hypothetical protein
MKLNFQEQKGMRKYWNGGAPWAGLIKHFLSGLQVFGKLMIFPPSLWVEADMKINVCR